MMGAPPLGLPLDRFEICWSWDSDDFHIIFGLGGDHFEIRNGWGGVKSHLDPKGSMDIAHLSYRNLGFPEGI